MAATYEPIASTTLGSDAADVTMSGIPGGYTDLILVVSANVVYGSTTYGNLFAQFNSDTGSNYSRTMVFGNGSTTGSQRESSQSRAQIGATEYAVTANEWMVTVMQVLSYSNTNVFKTWLSSYGAASNVYGARRNVGLWRSTNAITSIKVYPETADDLRAGTTVSLFGIKAA